MSDGAEVVVLAPLAVPVALLGGIVAVGAAGVAAAGVALSLAADGALALGELLRGGGQQTVAVALPAPLQLQGFRTSLRVEAIPVLREGLQARGIAFHEGGALQLADGGAPLTYTAHDAQGRVLFFAREGADGFIELLTPDAGALPVVEDVLAESLMRLADHALRAQGFRRVDQEGRRWRMERVNEEGLAEEVVFDYRRRGLSVEARTFDDAGNLLRGKDCPDITEFTDYFGNLRTRPLGPREPGGSAQPSQPQPGPEQPVCVPVPEKRARQR